MWTESRLWQRVTIEGDVVRTSPEVRISEGIDQLSRVAEFNLAEQPSSEPDVGDSVLIELVDRTTDYIYSSFAGTVNAVTTESQPWSMSLIANDQLRLLDRVRQSTDLDLTGMTPKEALMEVLDYVGCTYDPDDLADPDYVLGEREDIAWMLHTPGSTITDELSKVFGCVLMTVGADRILWLSHDSTPANGTGSYGTYTRGTSINFAGHGRTHGDRARIQNTWTVRGVTSELNENCTAQPWAKALGTNPQLGRKRRTVPQEFTSDLIQSEDLAEAIVRRLMRQTNRLPDERTTPMVNDINVHPCTKITIVDPTYGMGADPTYATVLTVDRQGNQMTLRLAAGPGGSEGTVTTGVDKVCNDIHGDLDWPGTDFDFPDFDFPPIDLGSLEDPVEDPTDDEWTMTGLLNVVAHPAGGTYATTQSVALVPTYECTIYYTIDGSTPTTGSSVYSTPLTIAVTTTLKFFGRADAEHISPVRTEVYTIEEEEGDCDLTIDTGDWDNHSLTDDQPIITTNQIEVEFPDSAVAWENSLVIPVDQDWLLVMDVTPIGGILIDQPDEVEWQIGVGNTAGWSNYAVQCFATSLDIYGANHLNDDGGAILPAGIDFANTLSVAMLYDAGSGDIQVTVSQGATVNQSTISDGGGSRAGDFSIQLTVTSGIVHFSNLCFQILETDVFVPGDWTIEFGDASAVGPGQVSFFDDNDAQASYDRLATFPTDTPLRVQWRGFISIGDADGVFLTFALSDLVGLTDVAYIQILLDSTGGDIVYAQGFDAGTDESAPGDLGTAFFFALDFDPDTNTLTGHVGSVTVSCDLDWDTENDVQPTIDHGTALTLTNLVISDMLMEVTP